jgi:arabinofuranan 3-O-arabinosyltransferase
VNRDFTVHTGGTWTLSGQAVALPTASTARTLLPLGRAATATADSVLANDPSVSGTFALDGRADTAWLANLGDYSPVLKLAWDRPRRLDRLRLDGAIISSVAPYEAVLEANGEKRVVSVGPGQTGFFKPLVARSATITFRAHPDPTGVQLPVGVGEVRLDGLQGLVRGVALDWKFDSGCGLGPSVSVNGVVHRTSVSGTLRDIVDARPVSWRTCDGPVTMKAGDQRISAEATDVFTPTMVVLKSQIGNEGSGASRRLTGDLAVSDAIRMRVGPGPAAVLTFGQNSNAGWKASLAGAPLAPTVVDGWQQGFVVPPGDGGKVEVHYGPSAAYYVALGIGALAALALVLLLALDLRRPARPEPLRPPVMPARQVTTRGGRRRWRSFSGLLLTLGALALLGGPLVAIAVVVGVVLAWRGPGTVVPLALGSLCVFASGVAAVYSPRLGSGSPDSLANGIAAVGAGLLFATLTRESAWESQP